MFKKMFKRAKKGSNKRGVEVWLNEELLYSGELVDLPLKDEWILKKSIEFFDDHAPCYLHRSAVTVRLLDELWESTSVDEGSVSAYIDFPEEALVKKLPHV
jgi:hypothetical protein